MIPEGMTPEAVADLAAFMGAIDVSDIDVIERGLAIAAEMEEREAVASVERALATGEWSLWALESLAMRDPDSRLVADQAFALGERRELPRLFGVVEVAG